MEAIETVYVQENRVSCDGGKGELGHPKVYLDVGKNGEVVCPYCSKTFVFGVEKS